MVSKSVTEHKIRLTGAIINPDLDGLNDIFSLKAPRFSKLKFPTSGLNLFYGHDSYDGVTELVNEAYLEADANGDARPEIELVEVVCTGIRSEDAKFWMDTYVDRNTFDMRRLSTGRADGHNVKEEIVSFFGDKALQLLGSKEEMMKRGFMSEGGEYHQMVVESFPQFIDDLRREKEWMKSIDILIWGARLGALYDDQKGVWVTSGRLLTRATLFNSDCIQSVRCGNPDFMVDVPDL